MHLHCIHDVWVAEKTWLVYDIKPFIVWPSSGKWYCKTNKAISTRNLYHLCMLLSYWCNLICHKKKLKSEESVSEENLLYAHAKPSVDFTGKLKLRSTYFAHDIFYIVTKPVRSVGFTWKFKRAIQSCSKCIKFVKSVVVFTIS